MSGIECFAAIAGLGILAALALDAPGMAPGMAPENPVLPRPVGKLLLDIKRLTL
jgi:hypothetical protein